MTTTSAEIHSMIHLALEVPSKESLAICQVSQAKLCPQHLLTQERLGECVRVVQNYQAAFRHEL